MVYPHVKNLSVEMLSIYVGVGVAVWISWAIFVFCIPFYRYRYLFLVKAEHPDWGASQCMQFCRDLMKGNMMKSFRLDCSYWKPITLVLMMALAVEVSMLLTGLLKDNVMLVLLVGIVGLLALFACFAGCIALVQYIGVGQGFLYQDLKDCDARRKGTIL